VLLEVAGLMVLALDLGGSFGFFLFYDIKKQKKLRSLQILFQDSDYLSY